ncbi:hypothetical protein Skr01_73390 [Sphaerisporangium krabiense]|uniref:Putative surface protein with fasciclin (FAS1) repeats n=1 Tax=Sphaerisporangium krabiense TaxID=763782 RepID=A0A7W8Z8U4_9ACTN|nr:fasciclin domain-containing protein [Sphaerisporangium krabiense]MBB5629596.1 putative surface protein with fasciclin (FAS1) repeats [Sphaerisporangium krabiense]GII67254.1 hypothetical protein Skr01_73390 [Sphaerisporangium krabiense]
MNAGLLALPIAAVLSLPAAQPVSAARPVAGGGSASAGWHAVVAAPVASAPVGPACKTLPQSGRGSVTELGRLRVDTAIAHSPDLSTLNQAIQAAGLAHKLNTAKNITVFAPTDEAFKKLGKRKLDKLLADRNALTQVLTYHVVQGRKTPKDLKKGEFPTVEGAKITTKGSGDKLKVDKAKVACGDIRTRNANLYVIDAVLTPKR